MTRRKGAKADMAVRGARFAEEDAFGQAVRVGSIDRGRPARYQPRRPSGTQGIDYATRMEGMFVHGPNPRISDDVGSTIAAIDWQANSYQRRKVAGGTSLTTTATGGKRLHAAGPGLPEQAKRVAQ